MRGAMHEDGFITVDRQNIANEATLEFAQSAKSDVGLCSDINESRRW